MSYRLQAVSGIWNDQKGDDMLSIRSRLIKAVLAFIYTVSTPVRPVQRVYVRIPVQRVNRK